eukprot:355280-Chlamydomonas_euryale.AAC.5
MCTWHASTSARHRLLICLPQQCATICVAADCGTQFQSLMLPLCKTDNKASCICPRYKKKQNKRHQDTGHAQQLCTNAVEIATTKIAGARSGCDRIT